MPFCHKLFTPPLYDVTYFWDEKEIMLNGCKYFPLSRIFSGSEGQQAADPRVHADIRQRNKDGGPGNWENSTQLFNLQVKRKELLTKFLLYKVQRRLL